MKKTNTGRPFIHERTTTHGAHLLETFPSARLPGSTGYGQGKAFTLTHGYDEAMKNAEAHVAAVLGGEVIARAESWVRELVEPTDTIRVAVLQRRQSRRADCRARGLKRWGTTCVHPNCTYNIVDVLEVAHLTAVKDGGSDHSDNLRPMCPTHHAEYDLGMWHL